MKISFKILLLFVISLISLTISAQTTGDKLFSKGQQQQQIMTYAAQKKAISYFTQAKKAYDSAAKKSMCDSQIKICQNTIKVAPWKKTIIHKTVTPVEEKHEIEKDDDPTPVQEEEIPNLQLSESVLEFNSKAHTETISVTCDRTDWHIDDNLPSWISITLNGKEITLSIQKNKEKEDREYTLKVTCGKACASLIITQHKWSFFLKKGYDKVVGK